MYTIVWVPSALDDLAEIWLRGDAAARGQITEAAHHIDRCLRSNPADSGESREGNRRILLVPPLGVTYVFDEGQRLARVLAVWQFTTHSA
jgi:hypothetical protein